MNATFDLPTLPLPRARALALLNDDHSGVAEISDLVAGDPGLTVAVLRAANSAISAPVSRVRSPAQAIVRIGIGATRRIVTGAVVGDAFDHLDHADLHVDALWRHLVATALLTETLARVGEGATDAFTAGLLHDVGRLAMASRDPNRYARVVNLARRGVSVRDAEQVMFGTEHGVFGAELAEAWRLPESVITAIAGHHDTRNPVALARAVARARDISMSLGLGDGVIRGGPETLDPDSADAAVVRELRGTKALLSRVEWYREAIQVL